MGRNFGTGNHYQLRHRTARRRHRWDSLSPSNILTSNYFWFFSTCYAKLTELMPNAQLVADIFHVMTQINRELDTQKNERSVI
ncbi:transposase [Nostoc sp. NOS(2021)]|uniref:transposase n=1 Tax=Nostoc sp. NOS(2021) TaxID=2815407 RepID=UPI0025E8A9E7|nr:transposase [Nostoc sp. NOS(2021)]